MQTVSRTLHVEATECVAWIAPLLLVHLTLAIALFWAISARAEVREQGEPVAEPTPDAEKKEGEPFRVNWLKAAVPLLPMVLLFLTGPPLDVVSVPRHWLMTDKDAPDARPDSRLIGAAMLVGVAAAAVVGGRDKLGGVAAAFFEGAGYAYTCILSVIVSATCFGKGVEKIGLAGLLGRAVGAAPGLLTPCAAAVPLLFALLCGSGMASTQSLFGFFVDPARALGVSPVAVGAVVSIAAAAGRTMSPVAAVTLMSAQLSGSEPIALARRVAVPLLAGIVGVVLFRLFWPY